MEWQKAVFVLGIITVSLLAGIINHWISARHGHESPNGWHQFGWGGRINRRSRRREGEHSLDDARKIMLLAHENEKLTGQVGRLEERIAVLERIATDPAERTAREIEALRTRA